MEFKILSRNNFMLYRGASSTTIRTYFKEAEVQIEDSEHESLLEIIRKIQTPVNYSELMQFENTALVLKLLKLLHDFGAIFIYPVYDGLTRTELEICVSKKWFSIYSQYASPNCNISTDLQEINKTVIIVTEEVNSIFPGLISLFTAHMLEAQVGMLEISDRKQEDEALNASRYILITMDPSEPCEEKCVLEVSPSALYCWLEDKKHRYYTGMKFADLNINKNSDQSSLLSQTAPVYILIYVFKTILGISKPLMMINDEGKFYEQETLDRDYTMVIPATLNIVENKTVEILQSIEHFERFLAGIDMPLRISGIKDKVFANLQHAGYTIYGLSDTERNNLFCNVGLDYETTAYEAIRFGLKRYLEISSGEEWIVSDSRRYYVDKALLLIQHFTETPELYHVSRLIIPEGLEIYMEAISHNTEVYVEFYPVSGTGVLILYDTKKMTYYTSLKKEIDIPTGLISIILNYTAFLQNPDSVLIQVYQEMEVDNIWNFQQAVELVDWDRMNIDDEQFITRFLELSKKNDIRYDEFSWIYEKYLVETGLIVRMIKAGGYNGRL